jgi:hypothetical protein
MEATPRLITCMKATLEPRFIKLKSTTKKMVTKTELTGTSSVGETYVRLAMA